VGRGLRRTALIGLLEAAASAHSGVRIEWDEVRGVEWESGRVVSVLGNRMTYRARVYVAADGVNSRMAEWCGGKPWKYAERMAVRRHYRLAPGLLPPRVQVGLLGSHDLYLTPVGNNELLATTLTNRVGYRSIVEDYDGFLRSGPYAPLFAASEPASETLSWYHPLFHARHYAAGGVLLVGDAGGGIDPCLGMGMSLALRTAESAAGTVLQITRNERSRRQAESAFVRDRKRLFLHYHHFGRLFRTLVGSPHGARALMWTMGRLPHMANRLLAIVADQRPWWTLVGRDAAGPQFPDRQTDVKADGDAAAPFR
jgi:2-polyprenyl-6-methoxyphenol hydroxylase-like FAD-dependent oxidoreductase